MADGAMVKLLINGWAIRFPPALHSMVWIGILDWVGEVTLSQPHITLPVNITFADIFAAVELDLIQLCAYRNWLKNCPQHLHSLAVNCFKITMYDSSDHDLMISCFSTVKFRTLFLQLSIMIALWRESGRIIYTPDVDDVSDSVSGLICTADFANNQSAVEWIWISVTVSEITGNSSLKRLIQACSNNKIPKLHPIGLLLGESISDRCLPVTQRDRNAANTSI